MWWERPTWLGAEDVMGKEEQFELGRAGAQLWRPREPPVALAGRRAFGRVEGSRDLSQTSRCPLLSAGFQGGHGALAPDGGEEGRRSEEGQHPRPQECGGTQFPELGETWSFCLGRLGAGPRRSWGNLEPECIQPLAILRVSLEMKGPALPLLWYLLLRLRLFCRLVCPPVN